MFTQNRTIPDEHKAALQGVVRNHIGITAAKLVQLYEAALGVLISPNDNVTIPELPHSRLVTDTMEIAVVTERKSGYYLQLSREKGKTKNFLTMGQKWAMEQPDPARSTINIVYW